MAQRRFGPTRGAGTAIIEKEGEKSIDAAALGWAGYAGVLEKGPTDKLIIAPNKKSFNKQCGSYIDDSLLPDCCEDYYKLANGAGGLLLQRVTDGNEQQAWAVLHNRDYNTGIPTAMGKIKSKNGGRWGGKAQKWFGAVTDDPAPTTLEVTHPGAVDWNFTTDQLKGGYFQVEGMDNITLDIVGNDESIDDTVLIHFPADVDVQALIVEHSPTGEAYMWLENEGKSISYIIGDGEEKPDEEFSLAIYVDGAFVKKWGNLNTNPTSPRYWVNIINNDGANNEIEVEDLWTGAHTALTRPANFMFGPDDIVANVINIVPAVQQIASPTGGNPSAAPGTFTDDIVWQKVTVTMTSPTAGDVEIEFMDGSWESGPGMSCTLGTLFDPSTGAGGAVLNKWLMPWTITAGATPLVAGDVITLWFFPPVKDSMIGGRLYPDIIDQKNLFYNIIDNDATSITVTAGVDLEVVVPSPVPFRVEYAEELQNGRDGIADLVDADYINAWDTNTSLFNRIVNKNMGLVKFATPGVYEEAIQKAGAAYANAKNHQYRYEVPSDVITNEILAKEVVNDILGRNDFAVLAFPSYGYVVDPFDTGDGKRKLVPLTGMIHGREARIAADYDGYHKAQAGEDATLPAVLDIPTGDAVLDEEILNPVGIQVIKKVKGNYIIWGDRMLNVDPTWKWKHQREQMSYYEHVLQENFGWIIFSINDSVSDRMALAAMRSFFYPEWVKRALRGDNFTDAAIIKIDEENNTDATRAAGDKNAEVSLRLADTTERFIITIGKQGIFESVAA